MNWILISVLILWAIIALIGYKKGFIRMIYTLSSFVIGLILAAMLSPMVENCIIEKTQIDEYLVKKYTEVISDAIEEGKTAVVEKIIDISPTELSNDKSIQLISENQIHNAAEELSEETIGIIVFVLVWIIVGIILRIILGVLKIVEILPVVKSVNRILGFLSGALIGLFAIWLFFAIVSLATTTEFGTMCMEDINENKFLTTLYEFNILLKK